MAEVIVGQAVTQPALSDPTTPLNEHQAVEYMTSVLEGTVEKEIPEKPRDESGKFTKQEPEAKPETEAKEEPAEETEEAAAPEEAQEETKQERRLRLKYKGEEREVDEAEAVELAQKGYDYTQKSQALAKEREELAAKVKAETEAAQKKYEAELEVHKQAVLRLADPEAMNADLNKLSMEDPARAQQLFFKRLQIQQTLQGIAMEQQRIAQQRDAEAQASKQKQVSEALETIQRDIPGWGQDLYGKILKTAVDLGYTQQEANAITDPKVVKLLNEARQWREYQSAKPKTVDKRVAAVPKVQKPGTAEKAGPGDKVKVGMEKLGKTGDVRDAFAVVQELERLGRL